MSSIRIFILSALSDSGPMHGHQLRLLADEEHLDWWTDISVGGLYGALKRLAAEDLIEEDRVEREGNYPPRTVWRITADGRRAVWSLKRDGLSRVVFKPDPFDLVLSRPDREQLDDLPAVIAARVASFEALLAEHEAHLASVARYLSVAESMTLEHRIERIRTELAWHRHLLERLDDLVADERSRKDIP